MTRGSCHRIIIVLALAVLVGCSLQRTETANTNGESSALTNENGVVVSGPEAGGGESRSVEAERLVADLYKVHDAKKSPFFQTNDRGRVDRYFTKTTADLIWKDATTSAGEIGVLDFDPLYDAQDVQLKDFKVNVASVNGEVATVPVTFTNFGEKKRLNFVLKLSDGKWRIDDIAYQAGHSLLAILREAYVNNTSPTASATGEFKGTYRVGDTTCTVRPDRQAFEVRWIKGSGSEYYFFKEATVFESEPDGSGRRNEFRFDDENYNSGTFIRADGKTFVVSRSK